MSTVHDPLHFNVTPKHAQKLRDWASIHSANTISCISIENIVLLKKNDYVLINEKKLKCGYEIIKN